MAGATKVLSAGDRVNVRLFTGAMASGTVVRTPGLERGMVWVDLNDGPIWALSPSEQPFAYTDVFPEVDS